MAEPRFPPPHGQTGYRDSGTSAPDLDAPKPPELDGPELPRGKRVVATRPDDPDVALAKAFTPPRATRREQVSRAGVVVLAIIVIMWAIIQVATAVSPRRHRVSSPPCAGQHC